MVPESPRERSSTKKSDRSRKIPDNAAENGPQQETLRSHLGALSSEDPDCIFVCRRVNHLGFHSRELLRQHFAPYGPVSRVFVAHMKVKSRATANGGRRVRPGGLGIVVMQNAEDAKRILEGDEEQEIAGHKVRIGPFEQPAQKSREIDTDDAMLSEEETEDSGNVSTKAESGSHGFDSTSNGGSNTGGSGSNGGRSNGTSNVGSSNVGSNGSEDSNGASNGSGSGSDRSGANGSDPGANGSDQSQPDQNGSDCNSSPSGGASD